MSIRVKEIAFVAFPVTDIARARDFYERLLGLRVGRLVEGAGDKWWIEYDIAGVAFAVTNLMPADHAGSAALMLEVDHLDRSHAAVCAAGIPIIEELQEYPLCRHFAVRDPDGNLIGLHEHKPAHLIPIFDPARARKVSPYAHAATGGRIAGYHQDADGGHIHVFSSTGVFIATEIALADTPPRARPTR